jgi:excisionase family DNA binding protein
MGKCGESLWRIEDLAEYLAVSAEEVQQLVDLIGIPHLKISQHLRFRKADIDRWLDSLKSPSMGRGSVPASGPMISLADVERRKSDSREPPPYDPKPTQKCYQLPYLQPQRIEVPQKTTTSHLNVIAYEHRDLQGHLRELGEINGFRVTLDQPIPEEETPIEVTLERDAWKLAFLILPSLPVDKDVFKIKRCLSSGFDETAIAFVSRKHTQQGEPLITQNLTKEELVRLHLLAPDELSSYIEGITTLVCEKTDLVHGYKVRTRYYRTNPADQERRKRALSKIIAESILRQRMAAMRNS